MNPEYYSAADIARALSTPDSRVNKKFVQRTAAREAWPSRPNGNRIEFQPPQKILEFLVATPARQIETPSITVKFADLVASDDQQRVVLLREPRHHGEDRGADAGQLRCDGARERRHNVAVF